MTFEKGNTYGRLGKGRKFTEEHKEKIRKALTGKKHQFKERPWQKGKPSPTKGMKMSEETRKKMSDAKKGCVPWNKGIQSSDETRKKISIAKTGVKASEETKQKMSLARKGKYTGEESPFWKGELASYHQKHRWIEKIKGEPSYCEHCERTDKKKYEWANIDHKYRRVSEDYIRLCSSCHRIYDIKYNNYKANECPRNNK